MRPVTAARLADATAMREPPSGWAAAGVSFAARPSDSSSNAASTSISTVYVPDVGPPFPTVIVHVPEAAALTGPTIAAAPAAVGVEIVSLPAGSRSVTVAATPPAGVTATASDWPVVIAIVKASWSAAPESNPARLPE